MDFKRRIELCREIEEIRKRPLIVYATSKRVGVRASMSMDVLPFFMQQLDKLPKRAKSVDILISSNGGDPMVSLRMASLLRERVGQFSILVPHSAFSAATTLALGADEIVMHPNANLGPVDMQVRIHDGKRGPSSFSTEDIEAFVEFVRDNLGITDQEHLRTLFGELFRDVGPLGIGFSSRSSKLAQTLGEKLLSMNSKFEHDESRIKAIIDGLSKGLYTHAYPLSRTEAKEMGLHVAQENDPKLEDLIWKLWLTIEAEMEETSPTSPFYELSKSPSINQLFDSKHPVDELVSVDFKHAIAIIQSSRLAHTNIICGKVLASRHKNLSINTNQVATLNEWQKVPIPRR